MTNLPPFYKGQRVVCIKTHYSGVPKKGIAYTVLEIHQLPCCGIWVVDYGEEIKEEGRLVAVCPQCNMKHEPFTGKSYLCIASFFAPITENFQSISLEKVLETETPLISVN